MTDLLTESFCERCGTRYTFESRAPRQRRLSGLKTVSRGLKNFVLSDDASLDEAMAAARSESEREAVSEQLEAFHDAFNFCMTCRQYTCSTCWNGPEGRCLTCAPDDSREALGAPFTNADVAVPAAAANGAGATAADVAAATPADVVPAADTDADGEAWPELDLDARLGALGLPAVAAAGASTAEMTNGVDHEHEHPLEQAAAIDAVADEDAADVAGATEAVVADDTVGGDEPMTDLAPAATAEPVAVAGAAAAEDAEPAAAAAAPDTDEPAEATIPTATDLAPLEAGAPAARAERTARQTSAILARFRPGMSLDDAIAAYEVSLLAARSATAAAADAGDPSDRTSASAPARPTRAAPAPSVPEPAAAEVVAPTPDAPAAAAAASRTAPDAAPPVPADDHVTQPVWTAPRPAESAPPAAPQWPAADGAPPRWPGQPPEPDSDDLTFLLVRRSTESLWAASSREVAAGATPSDEPAVSIQSSDSCGLSLSATARFCRRCGSRQAH
jgi:hypothetical protein